MACFIVPVAEAVVTTILEKVIKTKEKEKVVRISFSDGLVEDVTKIKFSQKLSWLNKLLWGGSALLAFEHIWHGEIIFTFPFLSAVETGQTMDMLAEMASAGTLMAILITTIWFGMLVVSSAIEKKAVKVLKLEKAGV